MHIYTNIDAYYLLNLNLRLYYILYTIEQQVDIGIGTFNEIILINL